MQKIKVIELFAGYGSQHLALKRLKRDYPEFDFEVVAFCEIDKYAIKAYQALHGDKIPNLGDITKVNPVNVPDCDLMTWSFPCTDISSAGAQCGLAEGSNTRSSLCWDAMRIFEVKRPKYLLMENVSALVSQKFLGDFNKLQSDLQNLGYTNFFKLINAKDMGVPQNRLRIFMVSILDCQRAYYFPQPFPLTRRLKDVLEQNVEERYYLKEEQVEKLVMNIDKKESKEPSVQILGDLQPDSQWQGSVRQQNQVVGIEGIAPACTAEHYMHPYKIAEPQDNIMLGWTRSNTGKGDPTYHPVSVANCVTAAKRDNTQNYILEPTIAAMRGRDKDNPNDRGKSTENYAQRLELKQDGTSNTLTSVAKDNLLIEPSIISPGHGYFKGAVNDETSPTVKCSAMQAQHFLIEPTIIEDFYGTVRDPRLYTDEAPTLRADRSGLMTIEGIRIRRLTERELFRLMDVDEKDIDTLLAAPIPRTQHAKLAGNSIVLACLYYIFRNLFVDTEPAAGTQTMLF